MLGHVRFWQLDADGEEAGGEDDAHDFEGDPVGLCAPGSGIEYLGAVGAHENAEGCSKHDFVYEELECSSKRRSLSEVMMVPTFSLTRSEIMENYGRMVYIIGLYSGNATYGDDEASQADVGQASIRDLE